MYRASHHLDWCSYFQLGKAIQDGNRLNCFPPYCEYWSKCRILVLLTGGCQLSVLLGCQFLPNFWHISYQFHWAGHIWECNHTALGPLGCRVTLSAVNSSAISATGLLFTQGMVRCSDSYQFYWVVGSGIEIYQSRSSHFGKIV